MAKPKILIATIRYACPVEEADVPALLARIAGPNGFAQVLSTDMLRDDLASYRAKMESKKSTHGTAPAAPPSTAQLAKTGGKRADRAARRAAAGDTREPRAPRAAAG
ncbi:MAG TPA: hypothetical protein VMN04_02540 [Thermoanaerobaculia bacterium]|nr:hypothetical protein [Thermoanaerobaculia bacterium]